MIHPEDIRDEDSAELKITRSGDRTKTKKQYRDLIRRVACGMQFAMICVEEQSYVDYAMPVRVMSYNASRYEQQIRIKKEEHRKKRDLRGDEFLSGITRDDRFLPVITIVLYFGKHWDGARDLKELLKMEELPSQLQELAGDYPIYVVEAGNFPHAEQFQTDLKQVFGFCQYADDKEKLRAFVEKEQEALSNLSEEAYDLISAVTHTEELEKMKKEKQTGKEQKDMCKAIDDMLADARTEGKESGIAEGRISGIAEGRISGIAEGRDEGRNETIRTFVKYYLEEGDSKECICQMLQKMFSIDLKTAEKYFAK